MIKIWKFANAPRTLRQFCTEQDADWVLEAPSELRSELHLLLNAHGATLRNSLRCHDLGDGTLVFFGKQAASDGGFLDSSAQNRRLGPTSIVTRTSGTKRH
jgi:hypothetical protein